MTSKGKVLFVDDEKAIRLAGAQTLELAGCDAEPCDSGERALRLIGRDWPGVVVTDVRMPQMDGLTLMKRIQAIDGDLPVILITGHGDIAMAVAAMRDGAYDFIEKPYPADRLVDTVRRALEKRWLVVENRALKAELAGLNDGICQPIIGKTAAIERMRRIIASVATTDADVLIFGETGTGKELVARALHGHSVRRTQKFVALNCGALPESIIESELFGHEAGAFTGAIKRRVGRIEFASKGTLFLDEIESMPMSLQVKLLRVLQEREVQPLGSNAQVPVDLRVVAATKTSLKQASAEGRFREDLYYRLNVVTVQIPPLRERKEDIPLLFQHFVDQAVARFQREAPMLTPETTRRLIGHGWPGNVRELRNAADRFVLDIDDGIDLPHTDAAGGSGGRLTLADHVDQFEKSLIVNELANHQGNVKATIEALGVPRKTFYDKLRRYGLSRADFS
ncbi:MAG: response regulator [Azospirillum sp.]|nr:response regulator [Azospirillum sp.]